MYWTHCPNFSIGRRDDVFWRGASSGYTFSSDGWGLLPLSPPCSGTYNPGALMNKTGRSPWIAGRAQAVPESVVRVTDTERRLRVEAVWWRSGGDQGEAFCRGP